MTRKEFLKRGLNLMTVLGAGASAAAVFYAFRGFEHFAWILMGVGMVIDSIDGSLVRLLGLEDVLPLYDGDRLDEYADLITYVVAPVAFAWATGLLPFGPFGIAAGAIVCAVSCLQFSRLDNKTETAYWGWPSYWNILYFYCWAFHIEPVWVITFSLILSACVFAPIPFIYPSKLPTLRRFTYGFCAMWITLLTGYLFLPGFPRILLGVSLLFPAYYLVLSAVLHGRLKEERVADKDVVG